MPTALTEQVTRRQAHLTFLSPFSLSPGTNDPDSREGGLGVTDVKSKAGCHRSSTTGGSLLAFPKPQLPDPHPNSSDFDQEKCEM